MKFEEKLCRAKEDLLERMCWEQACRDEEEKWSRRDRQKSWNGKKELLESVGLSVREWNNNVREGTDRKQEIRTRLKEMYLEETEGDLKKSTYAREAKEIIGRVGRFYGKEVIRKSRNGLEILGRFRMGCQSRANEYWRKEEERKCRACNKGCEETIKHVLMECEITGKRDGLEMTIKRGQSQHRKFERGNMEKEETRGSWNGKLDYQCRVTIRSGQGTRNADRTVDGP